MHYREPSLATPCEARKGKACNHNERGLAHLVRLIRLVRFIPLTRRASHPFRAGFALALILGSVAPWVAAGTNQWTGKGPYGGLVTVLAVDPRTPTNVYAAGISGIFKSSDGGVSWSRASDGLVDPSVDAIAIDPVTPTTLYAGSLQGGTLAKSTNGGSSWTPLATGPTLVTALAVNPQTPATIYAAQQQSRLYRSTDGGASWTPLSVNGAPTFPSFVSIVVDPKSPNTVYAGEQTTGVYKSTDGGTTWSAVNTGFTGPIIQIYQLAVDPMTPTTVYAAASTSGGAGLYQSLNGGASWARVINDPSSSILVQAVLVDPQNSANVYAGSFSAGVMHSTNGGSSFTAARTGLPTGSINVLAINPLNPTTLYAGGQNGVYASSNSAGAWAASNNGLALTTVSALAVDPLTPATVYAGTTVSGLFKSADGGSTWAAINNGVGSTGNLACAQPNISSLAIDPVTPANVYAGTTCTLSSQVLKSSNGGATWTPSASGIPAFIGVTAVAVDPANTASIFAATTTSGLYHSSDSGAHWTASSAIPIAVHITGLAATVMPAAQGSQTLIAASSEGNSAYLSVDGGASFHSLTDNLTASSAPIGGTKLMRSKASGSDPCANAVERVIVGFLIGITGNADIRMSVPCTSEETDWTGFSAIWTFAGGGPLGWPNSEPTQGPTSKAVPTGVFTGVKTLPWGPPDGNVAEVSVCGPTTALVANPQDPTAFYAGGYCGVLKATNDGQQLVSMSTGLMPNIKINSLATTPSGGDIYAGAASGGVYRYTPAAAGASTVVEFYNAALDHYFISINPQEISDLDTGVHVGWARTGYSFNAYPNSAAATNPVCRFYIPPEHGDSHFFSADPNECASVLQKVATDPNYSNYTYETPSAFYIGLPDTTSGACPAGTNPVYRLWNGRADSNHRYTTDLNIRAAMIARGYVPEGYGALSVAMCAAS